MTPLSISINILAFIAFIIIIYILFTYIVRFIQKMRQYKISQYTNPPGSYMQNSGIKCPDYWVNVGTDHNGNYICKNSFQIPSTCQKNDQLLFPPVDKNNTWDEFDHSGLNVYSDTDKYHFANKRVSAHDYSRCQWINQCGPSSNTQGVWTGINNVCNNPPTVS